MRLTSGAVVVLLSSIGLSGRTEAFVPASRSKAFGVADVSDISLTPSSLLKQSDVSSSSSSSTTPWFLLIRRNNEDDDIDSSIALFAKRKGGAKMKQKALEALDFLDDMDNDEPMSAREQALAKKKAAKAAKKQQQQQQGSNNVKAAALEALDGLDFDDEDDGRPLSKKELKAAARQKNGIKMNGQKQKGGANGDASTNGAAATNGESSAAPTLSPKEAKIQKMLDLEAEKEARAASAAANGEQAKPKLSKKELKALKKKEEKLAAKLARKEAKKKARAEELGQDPDEVSLDKSEVEAAQQAVDKKMPDPASQQKVTLEEKIRKDRPPPRIRVMESPQPGYTSLRLENVGIVFREQEVLKDVTWGVQTGDRIGLVGQNGAGKTTQLRIMAGELDPTTGDVVKSSKDLRVAMLRQEFVDELVLDRTLNEEFMSVFEEEVQILEDIKQAETELENIDAEAEMDRMQEILDRMQDLQTQAENKGVFALEATTRKVMDLMGFTEDEGEDLVRSFSGGWKMRIGLGKVLLKEPNILMLDEPTNHLDLDSVEWLEEFLRQQNIPMIIVSHDREFLDQVCTKIVDAEGGACTEYVGNYSRFLKLKKARMDSWWSAYNTQEKKIKEERQWINKFKIKQPQAAKQRKAKLDKLIASADYVKKPPFLGKPFRFRFPDAPRISPEVAAVEHLTHSYRNGEFENKLFEDCELNLQKGDRIAVVGPNGAGKSTLLRFLIGKEKPDGGSASIIGQNVVPNYFEQNQADVLDLEKTVIETVQAANTGQSYNEMRALLGQFLFKGDAVEKKVRYLSGGEKARLSLCCMMMTPANLLILDEPTNHLDIAAKEMLEEALQHFSGSVIVISHDRYFISKVATTIVAIEDRKLAKYEGDYRFYMERSEKVREKVEARYFAGGSKIESAPVIDLDAAEGKSRKNFGGAKSANLVTRKNKGIKNAKRQGIS